MSRTIHTEVFKYSELSAEAQERARDWYRQGQCDDTFWSESVLEDFKILATACGFDIETSRSTRSQPAIYWEGFSHQGQGASFTASWRADRVNVAALLADWPSVEGSPGNRMAHEVCGDALELAELDCGAYGNTVAGRGQYQTGNEYVGDAPLGEQTTREELFANLCGDLAHWLYCQLEREWDYTNADEQVADNIIANEYEFTEDGERA